MAMIEVAKSENISDGVLSPVHADDRKILLTRVDGGVYAFVNKCPHLGLSLEKGTLQDGVVTCPWHGSAFNVASGENVDWCQGFLGRKMPAWTRKMIAMGKQPAPLETLNVEERDGAVFIQTGA